MREMPDGDDTPQDDTPEDDNYTAPSSTGTVQLRREHDGVIACGKQADEVLHGKAGKVDTTAKGVAMALAMFWRLSWVQKLPQAQGWMGEEGRIAKQLIRIAGGPEAFVQRLLWFPGLCRFFFWLGERRSPGAAAHILCRKLWFHDLWSRALAGGCRQVVVLGAGLDPKGLRLCRLHPDVLFVELDLAPTLRVKGRYLQKNPAPNLLLLGQDLTRRQPLAPLRELPAFHLQEPTLVLAEGLLMYLPQERAQALLRCVRKTMTGPVTVAFTCVDADPIRDKGIEAIQRALRRRKLTPFRWRIDATELAAWLQDTGLTATEVVDGDALQTLMLPSQRRGPGLGELMVLGM